MTEHEQALVQSRADFEKYPGDAPDFLHWLAFQRVLGLRAAFAMGEAHAEVDMAKAKLEDESKRADDYCRRWLDTRQALAELVRLKERKDKYGKTPAYEKRQPEAWTEARRVLNLPDIG